MTSIDPGPVPATAPAVLAGADPTGTDPDGAPRTIGASMPSRQGSATSENRVVNAILFVVLALGAVVMIAPLLWMFTTAVKTTQEVFALPPVLWPSEPQWDTFVRMWTEAPILSGFRNSFIVATTVTVLGSFTSALAAFALAKMRLPHKNVIFLALLSGIMIPFPTLMIPQFVMFSKIGWVDTLLPLIVPAVFGNIIMVFFLRQYLESVPNSVVEAAKIDGASYFQIFRVMILPIIRPAIAAQFILWFMTVWNDYLAPILYLNSEEKQTLQVVIANLNVEFATQRDYPLIMAASFVALLPIVIVFLIFQRQIIESVALTGTKG
ncbi:carbohydrate ABC transporter permease [Oerskovia flava]|uniref:carbohydrate ABC transporter permease n=1 Tax=Oerskovia flava TaxID=2986422 RepID=UPI0022403154|nr:carbohydrate ABC transporter permease [Oerskovia sp. JB1-3-2]